MQVQFPLILNLGTRFGKWPASRHGRLTTAEQPPVRYPLNRRLRGHRTCPNGLQKSSLVTAGNRTTIPWKPCPRPSHYTDWATPALVIPYMQCNKPILLVIVYTHLLRQLVLIFKDFTNTKQSSSSALQPWVGLSLIKYKTLVYYNSVDMFYYEIMAKSSNDIRLQ